MRFKRLRCLSIEDQEEYLNRYYQISPSSAEQFFNMRFLHSFASTFFAIAVGTQMINLMQKSIKKITLKGRYK